MKINQMLYDDKVLLKPSDYVPKDSYTDFYCDNTYCSGACEFDWKNSINSSKDDKQYPSHPLFIKRDKIHKLRKNYKVNLPEIKNSISNDNEYIKNKEIKDMLIEAFIFSELRDHDKPLKYYNYALFSDEAITKRHYYGSCILKDYFILWVLELFGKDELINIKEVRGDDPEYSTIGIIYKDFVFMFAFSRGEVGCFRFFYHTKEGLKKNLGKELNFYWLMGYYFNLSYRDKMFSIKSDKAFERNTKTGIFDRVMWEHSVFYDLYDPKETPKTMPSLFSKLLKSIETEEKKANRKNRGSLEPKKDFNNVKQKEKSSSTPPPKEELPAKDCENEGTTFLGPIDDINGYAPLGGVLYNGIVLGVFRSYGRGDGKKSYIFVFHREVLEKNIEYGNVPNQDIRGFALSLVQRLIKDGTIDYFVILPDDEEMIRKKNIYWTHPSDNKKRIHLVDFVHEFYPITMWKDTTFKHEPYKTTITSENIAEWATEFGKIHFGYCIPHSKNSVTYYYKKGLYFVSRKNNNLKHLGSMRSAHPTTPKKESWEIKVFDFEYELPRQEVAFYGKGGKYKTGENNKIQFYTYGKKMTWHDSIEQDRSLTRGIDW